MQNYVKLWISCIIVFAIDIGMLLFAPGKIGDMERSLLVNAANLCVLLIIYCACCVFDRIPHKMFFTRYALVLMILLIVLYICNLSPSIIVAAVLGYQIVLLIAVLYIIVFKWRISKPAKAVALIGFSLCGIYFLYDGIIGMVKPLSETETAAMIAALLMVNFTFTWLYKTQITQSAEIRDSYLHILTENVADIIFHYVLTPYPGFSYISASVEKITGYKQELFYKEAKLHMSLTHPDDREIIAAAFSPSASENNKNYVRWQRKDGEYIYLEFHNNPIYSGGSLVGIEGIFRDITDHKIAERELIDSKKSRQVLLSYISHELRTPITYIIGYAEALSKDLFESEEKKQNAIELIWTKAVFLEKLVQDLFQLSKMETNQFSYEFMQTNVVELFNMLNEQYEKHFSGAQIRFESYINDLLKTGQYEVLVDTKRIEQVFHNLLHNAVKYTDSGGKITSVCFLNEKKQCVTFQIKDTGEGISKEEQALIFKQFYQGENSSDHIKGSGLGLSLARLIIKAHGGEISVQSAKGEGSTFQFTIPLYVEKV